VIETSSHTLLGLNQQTYLRLKLALSLSLRRQVFIAVCDDLPLRDRLASRLQQDLIQSASLQADRTATGDDGPEYPRLVTLKLDLQSPNPVVQIAQWLSFNPPPRSGKRRFSVPAFQFLGIEQLTRQPAAVQRQFLTHLQGIERSLPVLDSSLLFWMPRPWFRTLPQSAQEFWRCRTAIFEFMGEPRPLAADEIVTAHSEPSAAVLDPLPLADPPPPAPETPPVPEDDPSPPPFTALWTAAKDAPAPPPTPDPEPAAEPRPPGPTNGGVGHRQPYGGTATLVAAVPVKLVALATANGIAQASVPATTQTPEPPRQETVATGPIVLPPPPVLPDEKPDLWKPVQAEAIARQEIPLKAAADLPQNGTVDRLSPVPPPPADPPTRVLLEEPPPEIESQAMIEVAQEERPTEPTAGTEVVQTLEVQPSPVQQEDPEVSAEPPVFHLADLDRESEVDRQIDLFRDYIEQLHQQNASPSLLADTYRTLGDIYRDRIEQGEANLDHLQGGVQAYEQVLVWMPETSPLWPDVLNDLGNLHWMLSRQVEAAETAEAHLQQAVQYYELGLARLDADLLPQNVAMIQNNLGAAYTDLARYGEAGPNLQRAVECYQEVLRYRTPQRDPARYASTQNNLGTAYWNLAQQERPRHYLKEAIAAYGEALEYCTSDNDPISFGMIQNNLGTAYWNLAQFEQPQHWLQQAIDAYQLALKYRTREVSLTAFAATQNNLGTAYWHLASQLDEAPQRLESWQKAIHAYDMALHAVTQLPTRQPLSFDLYASHANLGLAHYQMATDAQLRVASEACGRHLELALQHHVQAFQGWQQKPQLRQTALGHMIKTIRALYRRNGLAGQNLALSMVPADLLPELLPRL